MASNSPVFELLERNTDLFEGKDLIIAGDILDPMIFSFVKNTKSATVICDNYITCRAMAAMIGQEMDDTFPQIIEYKHVKLFFADVASAYEHIGKADTLLLLLSKNKQQTVKLISMLQDRLVEGSCVLTAGANDGGAKSADSLLKELGPVKKVDLARKCTLFRAIVRNRVREYQNAQTVNANIAGFDLKLEQDCAVFSCGRIDNGTQMLIDCLKDESPKGSALDLGCGCGVVGITLSKLGFKDVTSSDVSASALALTKKNAELNSCGDIRLKAADMLSSLGKYNLIAVNPPFHVGISTTTAPTVNMIISAKDHLTKDGVFYLVANAHLGYDSVLLENFSHVKIVKSSTTFIVYRARIS
ncbi:MAG: methyltransferase [Succinivibrio sp.]